MEKTVLKPLTKQVENITFGTDNCHISDSEQEIVLNNVILWNLFWAALLKEISQVHTIRMKGEFSL